MDERTVFQPSAGGPVKVGVRLNGIYEIEKLIGEGGMGEVYRGFTVETRDPVAIKMIRPDMSRNPDAVALFRREASTLHQLQHEAIVRYYVFSVDPDLRRAYLAMEFVDGVSLSKRLASGPLSLADVLILKSRIGGALEAAHQKGVVHRDISSDNLILPDGDVRKAKVIDFGIARSHHAGEGTIIGDGFAGKNKYASPEQLSGAPVTFKSDIYSFGLVLAEALRGTPIDMGGSTFEIVEKRRRVPDLSDIAPEIRPLIHSMLEPDPAARPASMAAVAQWTRDSAPTSAPRQTAVPLRATPTNSPKSSGGIWVGLVVLVAIASVGATLYVFRDDVSATLKPLLAPAPPMVVTLTKPPPLTSAAPPTSIDTTTPPASETPSPPVVATLPNPPPLTSAAPPKPIETTAPPATAATPPRQPGVPTEASPVAAPNSAPSPGTVAKPNTAVDKEVVMNLLRPRAAQSAVTLPHAVVGKPYHADLPAFVDPEKLSLRLEVEPAPPAGLTFGDLGQGKGAIVGTPTRSGDASFRVVATNSKSLDAKMDVTLEVEPPTDVAAPSSAALARPQPDIPTPSTAPTPPKTAAAIESPSSIATAPPKTTATAPAPAKTTAAIEPPNPGATAPPKMTPTATTPAPAKTTAANEPPNNGAPAPLNSTTVATEPVPAKTTAAVEPQDLGAVAPPPAPIHATLDGARVDEDFASDLPRFKSVADARGVSLRVETSPPEGLALLDEGGGRGRIVGKPRQSGDFTFDVVAMGGAGVAGRMTVAMTVAPRAPIVDRRDLFLSRYDGGSCFLARRLPDAADPTLLQVIGADSAALSNFSAAYRREVGADPKLSPQTIDAPECPALDILRVAANADGPPRLELKSKEVGRGHPLAGTVDGLNGRYLKLVAIGDDGAATQIPVKTAQNGASATFGVNLTADPEDVGHILAVLAIVSEKPFPALREDDLGKADQLAAKLLAQWAEAKGAADVGFAKLIK